MAEKVKDYSGACWNALIEEETKESIARLYIDSLDASRAEKAAVAELVEALGLAEGHLAEMLSDAKWHPIGHCPVLDRIRALLAKYAAKP